MTLATEDFRGYTNQGLAEQLRAMSARSWDPLYMAITAEAARRLSRYPIAGADQGILSKEAIDQLRRTWEDVLGNPPGSFLLPQDPPDPLPIILHCPMCHERHIDEGEFATKPHHTHACQHCGHVWRPAITQTVGVKFLPGFKNEEEPQK